MRHIETVVQPCTTATFAQNRNDAVVRIVLPHLQILDDVIVNQDVPPISMMSHVGVTAWIWAEGPIVVLFVSFTVAVVPEFPFAKATLVVARGMQF